VQPVTGRGRGGQKPLEEPGIMAAKQVGDLPTIVPGDTQRLRMRHESADHNALCDLVGTKQRKRIAMASVNKSCNLSVRGAPVCA
jgi:hypothetical protein